MAPICDEGELSALTAMFKGNETAATAFCDKLTTRVSGIEEGLNTFFLTIMGALVFIMHAGFAMVSWYCAAAAPHDGRQHTWNDGRQHSPATAEAGAARSAAPAPTGWVHATD